MADGCRGPTGWGERQQRYRAGATFKPANSPPEPFPTHKPTQPVFLVLNCVTSSDGWSLPFTYTRTFGDATTMRA